MVEPLPRVELDRADPLHRRGDVAAKRGERHPGPGRVGAQLIVAEVAPDRHRLSDRRRRVLEAPDVGENVALEGGGGRPLASGLGQERKRLAHVRDRELELTAGEGDAVAEPARASGPAIRSRRRAGTAPPLRRGSVRPAASRAGHRARPRPCRSRSSRAPAFASRRRSASSRIASASRSTASPGSTIALVAISSASTSRRSLPSASSPRAAVEQLGAVFEIAVLLGDAGDLNERGGMRGERRGRQRREDRPQLGELELGELLPAQAGDQLGDTVGVTDLREQRQSRWQARPRPRRRPRLRGLALRARTPSRASSSRIGSGSSSQPGRPLRTGRPASTSCSERAVAGARRGDALGEQRKVRELGDPLARRRHRRPRAGRRSVPRAAASRLRAAFRRRGRARWRRAPPPPANPPSAGGRRRSPRSTARARARRRAASAAPRRRRRARRRRGGRRPARSAARRARDRGGARSSTRRWPRSSRRARPASASAASPPACWASSTTSSIGSGERASAAASSSAEAPSRAEAMSERPARRMPGASRRRAARDRRCRARARPPPTRSRPGAAAVRRGRSCRSPRRPRSGRAGRPSTCAEAAHAQRGESRPRTPTPSLERKPKGPALRNQRITSERPASGSRRGSGGCWPARRSRSPDRCWPASCRRRPWPRSSPGTGGTRC